MENTEVIVVEHEDTEALKSWGIGLENVQEKCTLCANETRYLHRASKAYCCQDCANTHPLSALVAAKAAVKPRKLFMTDI